MYDVLNPPIACIQYAQDITTMCGIVWVLVCRPPPSSMVLPPSNIPDNKYVPCIVDIRECEIIIHFDQLSEVGSGAPYVHGYKYLID